MVFGHRNSLTAIGNDTEKKGGVREKDACKKKQRKCRKRDGVKWEVERKTKRRKKSEAEVTRRVRKAESVPGSGSPQSPAGLLAQNRNAFSH